MSYSGKERRKEPRIIARFIVSYRLLQDEDNIDVSQTRNLCLGGLLLTTNRAFERGTKLALEIRLPFDPHPIMLIGQVEDSYEVTKNLIYDTRLSFVAIDERHRKVLKDTVGYYLKRKE